MIDDKSPPGSWARSLEKPKQSERLVQRAIRDYLTAQGFISAHVPNGAQLAGGPQSRARQMNALKGDGLMVGFPDLIVLGTNARVGFMEVKNEGGKQNANQKNVQAWMERDGHKYAVVRSLSDVAETLAEWGWL
jgi:hypothetical protein